MVLPRTEGGGSDPKEETPFEAILSPPFKLKIVVRKTKRLRLGRCAAVRVSLTRRVEDLRERREA